jgi:hypothetical protein
MGFTTKRTMRVRSAIRDPLSPYALCPVRNSF